eukprot:1323819-Rhodomonas_salina.1
MQTSPPRAAVTAAHELCSPRRSRWPGSRLKCQTQHACQRCVVSAAQGGPVVKVLPRVQHSKRVNVDLVLQDRDGTAENCLAGNRFSGREGWLQARSCVRPRRPCPTGPFLRHTKQSPEQREKKEKDKARRRHILFS